MAYDTGPARSQGQGGAIVVSCFILCSLEAWLEGQGGELCGCYHHVSLLDFPLLIFAHKPAVLCVPPCFNFGSYLEWKEREQEVSIRDSVNSRVNSF